MLLFYDMKSYKHNSMLIQTSSAIPYISLFCHQQTPTAIFIFFSCTMHYTFKRLFSQRLFPTFIFICFPFFSVDPNQKQVLLIKFLNVVLTLSNVMKLDVENNSIVSTFPNVVSINAEIDNVDLTLFSVVNSNVDIQNVFFNVNLTLPEVARSYHSNNNVETMQKGFLGIGESCYKTTQFCKVYQIENIYIQQNTFFAAFLSF